MTTQFDRDTYIAAQDREKMLSRMTLTHRCAVCGSGLIDPWRETQIELECAKDKAHVGYVKYDPVLERLQRMRETFTSEIAIARVDKLVREHQRIKLKEEKCQ